LDSIGCTRILLTLSPFCCCCFGDNSTLAKADRKLTSSSSSFFGFGGGSTSKIEEARELYISAANQFKVEKKWKDSGDAFCKAAECSLKLGEKDDAGNDFWSAAKSYNKSNPERTPLLLS
jgi:alpha-soluble NSF attachment protein